MTYAEVLQKIDEVMIRIQSSIISNPDIPHDTGNLKRSIKIKKASYGYDIYLDTGNMTTKEWEENPVSGVAPYGVQLNEFKPYWRRLAFSIRDQLNSEIGASFNTEHRPATRRESRGGR